MYSNNKILTKTTSFNNHQHLRNIISVSLKYVTNFQELFYQQGSLNSLQQLTGIWTESISN